MSETILRGNTLAALFPFYFTLNPKLEIIEVGPRLHDMLPKLVGFTLEEVFLMEAPVSSGQRIDLSQYTHSIFLLRSRSNPLILLRGQMAPMEEGYFFAGTPWATAMEELIPLGLNLNDYAIHNSVADFLVAVQTMEGTVAELDGLAQNLVRQREELRQANRLLHVQRQVDQLLDDTSDFSSIVGSLLAVLGSNLGWQYGEAWDLAEGLLLATWGQGNRRVAPTELAVRSQQNQQPYWFPAQQSHANHLTFPLPGTLVLEWFSDRLLQHDASDNLLLAEISQTLANIAERWTVARQLRETESRRATVLKAAVDAIITTDQEGTILEFNPAAQRFFGWTAEALNRPIAIMLADYLDMEHYQELITGSTTQFCIYRADQLCYLDALRVETFIESGVLYTIFMRDITERRRNEDSLRSAVQAAQAADKAKTEFLAQFSHELRTPMNAIQGMADIALHSSSPSDVKECLGRIQINAMALGNLINDILDTSKIETGEFDLDDRPLDLWEMVDQAAEGLAFRAAQKGLEFFWTIDATVPQRIRGDLQRLRQILVNILGNAIKFTQQGEVHMHIQCTGSRLHIQVKDTGVGISPEDIQKVGTQKYWRGARTRGYQGTGLGMTITRSLIQQMGGNLEIESTIGVGSLFHVWLPLVSIPDTPRTQNHYVIYVLLLAEPTRNQVAQILIYSGYTVVAAAHPAELPEQTPTLLICEADNPAARSLASVLQPRGTRILGITTLGRRSEGPDDLDAQLVKPFGTRRLLERVETLLSPTPTPAGESSVRAESSLVVHPPRVLVVEDNKDNQQLALHALKRAGYDVYLAEDGEIAVEMAGHSDYALILMDLEMPVMDGFEATRLIRAMEATKNLPRTPIIALTAHAVEGYRQRCLDEGMDEYATKPIHRKRLVELVAQWVDHRPIALIVDDSQDNRDIYRRFLERDRRIRPICVADGTTALALFQRRPADIVVVDKEMPEMDGLELLEEILTLDPCARCVMLTGHNSLETRRRVAEAGAVRFATKPVDRVFFVEMMHAILAMPFLPRGAHAR